MFGPSMNTIFASRWKALWFFGTVMLTAYCTVPDASDTPGDDATAQKQVEQVETVVKDLKQSADNLKAFNQR
jgi:hypothetical protein